jgi:hypothetical protein
MFWWDYVGHSISHRPGDADVPPSCHGRSQSLGNRNILSCAVRYRHRADDGRRGATGIDAR